MTSALSRLTRMLMMALVLAVSLAQPASADDSGPSVLRDTEAEALLHDTVAPLVTAAGLDPKNVDVILLGSPEINAFVATGQHIYVYSGLILDLDNVNELQGVLAHELGHITAGDAIRSSEGQKSALGIQLATMVLGAIAIAAGAGDAGMGVMMAGQRAALGKILAFTRTQESTADASAVRFLHTAGISGKGMLQFFGKLQQEEYRLAIYSTDSFDSTHPLSSERIQTL